MVVVLYGIPFNASIWQAPRAHDASGKLTAYFFQCKLHRVPVYVCVYMPVHMCLHTLKKKNLNELLFNSGFMGGKKKKKKTKETYFQSFVFN